jgi:hypothetical protein
VGFLCTQRLVAGQAARASEWTRQIEAPLSWVWVERPECKTARRQWCLLRLATVGMRRPRRSLRIFVAHTPTDWQQLASQVMAAGGLSADGGSGNSRASSGGWGGAAAAAAAAPASGDSSDDAFSDSGAGAEGPPGALSRGPRGPGAGRGAELTLDELGRLRRRHRLASVVPREVHTLEVSRRRALTPPWHANRHILPRLSPLLPGLKETAIMCRH